MGRAVRGDQPAPTCQGCPSALMLAVLEARTPSRPVPQAHLSRGHPKVAETPLQKLAPRFHLVLSYPPPHQRLKAALASSDPES